MTWAVQLGTSFSLQNPRCFHELYYFYFLTYRLLQDREGIVIVRTMYYEFLWKNPFAVLWWTKRSVILKISVCLSIGALASTPLNIFWPNLHLIGYVFLVKIYNQPLFWSKPSIISVLVKNGSSYFFERLPKIGIGV